MSETHHERALSELLGAIARADRTMEPPPAIEQRVMGAARLSTVRPKTAARGGAHVIGGVVAAGVLIAVMLSRAPEQTPPSIGPQAPAVVTSLSDTAAPASPLAATAGTPARVARKAVPKTVRPRQPQREVLSFVPLAPMDVEELSGAFQIVRVQVPSAAFGRSGAGPIQADVLLGEDGLARAIRFTPGPTVR